MCPAPYPEPSELESFTGIRPGLCSVTFRSSEPAEVIQAVTQAGLEAIEWGGDMHVPTGNDVRAKEVKERTAEAGLVVASYGSYLRLGACTQREQEDVLRTAVELGAPRIRVWAGSRGSADADAQYWAGVVDDARTFADAAAAQGVRVGLEFHGGTLADRAESTAALLSEIDRDNRVGTYWQPPQGMPAEEGLAGLDLLAERVMAIHAFSWWPQDDRHPLAARSALWRAVLHRLAGREGQTDILLEFVRTDSPVQLAHDAATLLNLIEEASRRAQVHGDELAVTNGHGSALRATIHGREQ